MFEKRVPMSINAKTLTVLRLRAARLAAVAGLVGLAGCQVPFVTDATRTDPAVFAAETRPVFYQPVYAAPVEPQPQPLPKKEPVPQRRELYRTQFNQTYGLPVSNPLHRVMYEQIRDSGHTLPAIPISRVDPRFLRTDVDYRTNEAPGTIVVDTANHYLYFVESGGKAIRYGVGLGAAAFAWHGRGVIERKAKWPRWTPPAEMVARQPDLKPFSAAAGGADPGLNNPLGARAMYIYQNGKDTLYRVHGTPDWMSVGKATSSGCVRMLNQDVVDLFDRVPTGTPIVVL